MKILIRMLLCLVISFTLTEIPILRSHAYAGMISTGDAVTQMTRAQNQEKVVRFLTRDDVKNQMVKFGVSPEEATRRVASLSDAELKKVAGEIDHSTAGGDLTGILIVVLVVVLIIYLIKRI
jgi:hypothetical protein